ncbi:BON domain-containing protein [Marinobacter sp. SS8-8]|nr:BON domain-containing protein [Marinobacter sp. SS8-8]
MIWLIDDRFPGFVSSREAIDTAVRVARGVKGVKSVTNDMKLK